MTDVPGRELAEFSAAQAAIEPYRAGGIIDRAIGAPERSMDGIIQSHLAAVAMLNARGDTVQERPTYVFNPDSGLLINYAYRRDANPARQGFFADIVELDEAGRPRHGVRVVNPFATDTGFIHVAVSDNARGFAPSSVNLEFDSEDPTSLVPPNIEMADLLAMLQAEPIPEDMKFGDFLERQQASQTEMYGRMQERHNNHYLSSDQLMTPETDANLHLIITDREDSLPLEAASREVGVYPIVLTAQEIVRAGFDFISKMKEYGLSEDELASFHAYVDLGRKDKVRDTLVSHVPAFVTVDYDECFRMLSQDEKRERSVTVPVIGGGSYQAEPREVADRLMKDGKSYNVQATQKGPLKVRPIFSRLSNYAYAVDPGYPEEVRKIAHGSYELAIDPTIPDNLSTYTDWLRKARLDFALTLYLRGLNRL